MRQPGYRNPVLSTALQLAWAILPCMYATHAARAQSRPVVPTLAADTPSAAKAGESAAAPATSAEKRAEFAELVRVAQRRLESAEPGDTAAAEEVAFYKTVEAVLSQQEAVERQLDDLRRRQADLENQLRLARTESVDKKSPHSFTEFDLLQDELSAEKSRGGLVADRLVMAKAALESSQRARAKCEAKLRQSQESFDGGKDGPNAAELAATLEQARQAANLAVETVSLRHKEVARGELTQVVQRLAVQLKQEQVTRAGPLVVFSEADLQEQIAQIKKQEDAADAALASAQGKRQAAEVRMRDAQRQLDEELGDRAVLDELLAARRREHERWSDEVDLITQQLQQLAQLRTAWNRRFAVATAERTPDSSLDAADVKAWQTDAQTALDDLSARASTRIQRMADLRNDLATLADKADASPEGTPELIAAIGRQRTHLESMLASQQASLTSIESSRRTFLKLHDELRRGAQILSPAQIAAGFWQQVRAVWHYELFTIGEGSTTRYVTVKRVTLGLFVFVIGWFASRVLSGALSNRLLKRFRLSKDSSSALKTIAFYSLLAVAMLAALKTLDVPLTAFTILGGALAIGVGFGSQALINNFIGGLIMLAERPIRLGERIAFGAFDGVVEEVGFRSTKLRTLTDHLVTIPNSTLVNDSIENIARRRTIRRLMNVTITYDTPRERIVAAVRAIRAILAEKDIRERIHPIVGFEEFSPRVFFNEYNADSLNIQVVYWYAPPDWWDYMEHCERVNFRIMEEFERLGVQFACPTRTLYLAGDTHRDLPIRRLADESQSGGGPFSREHARHGDAA
jgi:small-conductance mechanosensitive channel